MRIISSQHNQQAFSRFLYPVAWKKISRLRLEKRRLNEKFPKIGIQIIHYRDAPSLAKTLLRIPRTLRDVIDEIVIFSPFEKNELSLEGIFNDAVWGKKIHAYQSVKAKSYGGSQKLAFVHSIERGWDYTILLHGSGNYPPELLADLIWPVVFDGKLVVFGSRLFEKLAALRNGMPFGKWLGNIVLTSIQNWLLGTRLTDSHCGYRIYSTDVITKIPFLNNTDALHFDTQLILQCQSAGYKIHEVPIPSYHGNEITLRNAVSYGLAVLASALKYRLSSLHVVEKKSYYAETNQKYQYKKSPTSSHQRILARIEPGSSVLDIGCGEGRLGSSLATKGVNVTGIDAIPREAPYGGIRAYFQMDLEDWGKISFRRKFDTIIIADVIEHLRNIDEVLFRLRQYLKPGGRLVVSTGNIALWFYRLSLLLGRFNYGSRGILDRTHVYLYTLKTFQKRLVDCRYKVVRRDYTGLPFELMFPRLANTPILRVIEYLYYAWVRLWPTLFAYQFILEAEYREPVEVFAMAGQKPAEFEDRHENQKHNLSVAG